MLSAFPSQKLYSMASDTVKVSTCPESLIPGILTFGSTIAWAIFTSLPLASAVARIIDRIYDWYLSGICSPFWFTTVAAPMLDPGAIYMLSQAIEIKAPADAAFLSINT